MLHQVPVLPVVVPLAAVVPAALVQAPAVSALVDRLRWPAVVTEERPSRAAVGA
ncbi:hypothetical protein [Cellulomonas sp. C5510]|uniref:hypothetical protein n=1 Tax=Cellulomonas sp. C5510 TaxID=2871170 RepID=UPI001C989A02|nr:hypothetical protein [Cellulomonas sp. C5510]QZN84178.1 hypothetical protein K5O09_09710 [Cellulomonas sp. C5510]